MSNGKPDTVEWLLDALHVAESGDAYARTVGGPPWPTQLAYQRIIAGALVAVLAGLTRKPDPPITKHYFSEAEAALQEAGLTTGRPLDVGTLPAYVNAVERRIAACVAVALAVRQTRTNPEGT